MHFLCRRAPWIFSAPLSILASLVLSTIFSTHPLLAEGSRNDFPPEVDYPDDAYDNDSDERKRPPPKEKPKSAKVERMPIPEPAGPSILSQMRYSAEGFLGLTMIVPTVDAERDPVGLVQNFQWGGRAAVFRNNWGIELQTHYASTPLQEVVIQDPDTGVQANQTRSVDSFLLLIGGAYKRNFASSKFHWIARVGYGSLSLTQAIKRTSGTTVHDARTSGVYLGAGVGAVWMPYLSSNLDIYQSILGGGKLGPVDAAAGSSGYGFMRIALSNHLRLMTWGQPEALHSLGAGLTVGLQTLSTPTPPTGVLVGGKEKFTFVLASAYLDF